MMPSGVPPMPTSMSVPEFGRHAEIAPATSPSEISRHRAPASRTSAISCLCRGRSRMHTVRSRHRHALGLGDPADVLADRGGDVDDVDGVGPDGDLVHVEHRRRVVHRAALGDRQHRDRVGHALAHQRRAVDRVDGEVARRAVAVADLFAVVEHRRVVLLAFADHHDAAHGHRVDQLAHGVDGGAVAALLVAAAHPATCRHRAGLSDSNELEGEVAVGGFPDVLELMAAILPLAGRSVGAGILALVTSEPQPAPRPAKPRLLQDGRDMFWSLAPLVVACVILAGIVGMCSFAPGGPAAGPAPDYDAPAALQADADALRIPIRVPAASRRLAPNSGSRAGIEAAARSRPGSPLARCRRPSGISRRPGCTWR